MFLSNYQFMYAERLFQTNIFNHSSPPHLINEVSQSIYTQKEKREIEAPFSSSKLANPFEGSSMGQVLDKFHGKQWREKQIRLITDKAYNRIKSLSGSANLSFEELYIAVLLVYNDINKRLPGPHFDPPSKEQVRVMMQACDMNLDGELNHEEFVKFMKQLTADTFIVVSQGLIITLVVAPTVAMATKKATEGVPGVGKVVQKLPSSIYASLVTLAIVWFQTGRQDVD